MHVPKTIRTMPKRRLGEVTMTVSVHHPLAKPDPDAGVSVSEPFAVELEGGKKQMCRRVRWQSVTDRMEVISRI